MMDNKYIRQILLPWQKGYHQGLHLCEGTRKIYVVEGGRMAEHE